MVPGTRGGPTGPLSGSLETPAGRAHTGVMDPRIIGTVMPVLEITLDPGESVVAESGQLSWMTESIRLHTSTRVGAGGVFGAVKRAVAGAGLFMTVLLQAASVCSPRRTALPGSHPKGPLPGGTPPERQLRPAVTVARRGDAAQPGCTNADAGPAA